MNPHELFEITMNPARRKLRRIDLTGATEAEEMFTRLMGGGSRAAPTVHRGQRLEREEADASIRQSVCAERARQCLDATLPVRYPMRQAMVSAFPLGKTA
jgi:hypothetical protein